MGTGEEDPEQLLANPRNARRHPGVQRDALRESLNKVGWIAPVIVNRSTGFVVDGHARVEEALSRGEPAVPVSYVELSPEEEAWVLATFDPIGAMADTDADALAGLLEEVQIDSQGLESMLSELAGQVEPPLPEPGDADVDDDLPQLFGVVIECGSEAEQVELLERFTAEGLKCRAII